MRIPSFDLNQAIALAATGLVVVPTFYHLVADRLAAPSRSFSLIPHKKRHIAAMLFRLGLIAGSMVVTSGIAELGIWSAIWSSVIVMLVLMSAASATDRRLTIDAESGLVSWTKISLPWWPQGALEDGFIDEVAEVQVGSNTRKMMLLGVGVLEQNWSVSVNGNSSSYGHYSEKTLRRIAEQVNDYLRAFRSHDSEEARLSRRRYREGVLAGRAPRLRRKAARAKRAQEQAAHKEERTLAKKASRAAAKEHARLRRVQQKFQE